MKVDLFDYYLPESLIAQTPSIKRDHSRLLAVNVKDQTFKDEQFYDIVKYFKKGDVLVRNNTKVLPARLFATKKETNAKVEVLLLKEGKNNVWECLVGNAKVVKKGTILIFKEGVLEAKCLEVKDEGLRMLEFVYDGLFLEILNEIGLMPLPPYIKSQLSDNSRYQTIYAKMIGSSAAPTAGFHFTNEIFKNLINIGVEIVDLTLHVGLDTFRPVKVTDTNDHFMHSEFFFLKKNTCEILNLAKKEGRRIIAIGTTSTRALEANYLKFNEFYPEEGKTNLFITPGHKFRAIDGLITNFHLPKSTLLMLVSAFAGREFILDIYRHAISEKYRFFSFGDAMFFYGKN
ncbi:MAG: tRNA preQ1(34) S-adenosylmethionine ribosyltransferase-isomerase QueA [Erysipelotrichia bacterium]|nr:tRNA preQ1(34) S-adenosylmethionine ribosyltransferase-isomerase QueA [Erysipelotrichia bacterium]